MTDCLTSESEQGAVISSSGLFLGTWRKKMAPRVIAEVTVNRIIGSGSSICAMMGDTAEKDRARVLHRPMA